MCVGARASGGRERKRYNRSERARRHGRAGLFLAQDKTFTEVATEAFGGLFCRRSKDRADQQQC